MSESFKPGKRPATYDDLLRAPADRIAEILDGEVHLSPRPAGPHGIAATVLAGDVTGAFHRRAGGPGGPGGWWICAEPEIHIAADVIVPDVAGWRRERMTAAYPGAYVTLSPDWVCEVISPSSASRDRVAKMRIYAREKVPWVWLVDPLARTVEVYRLEADRWVQIRSVFGSAPARLEPFEAVELDLSRWWGETPDPPLDSP